MPTAIENMKEGTYTVRYNEKIATSVFRMRLDGDTSAFVRGGQFVDVAVEGFFLRRPLAVREWDGEGFDVLYKVVGKGTEAMTAIRPGSILNVLTGLGNGFDISLCRHSALVVCGGLGTSPAFTLVKELKASGKDVTLVAGFNTSSDLVLRDEYAKLGVNMHISTMDGSCGMRGLVTDVIDVLDGEWDCFYTCGPTVMMKAVCAKMDIPGEVSLEERMGCGCGICYGCTCRTTGGPKRVCADGPVFKKEEIIW